jgi:hypothetical protein
VVPGVMAGLADHRNYHQMRRTPVHWFAGDRAGDVPQDTRV